MDWWETCWEERETGRLILQSSSPGSRLTSLSWVSSDGATGSEKLCGDTGGGVSKQQDEV